MTIVIVVVAAIVSISGSPFPQVVKKHIPVKTCKGAEQIARPHIDGMLQSQRVRVHAGPFWRCRTWV